MKWKGYREIMDIPRKQFEQWTKEAIDNLPEIYLEKLHNVAFFIEDYPTKEQIKKLKLGKDALLFGFYEGYHQASRKNLGPVLPDRITLFRKCIAGYYSTKEEIKRQIGSTIKHEIAHHFGSGEKGARKAGKRKI